MGIKQIGNRKKIFSILYAKIKIFLALTKFKISLLATLSTATGFIIATDVLSIEIIIPTVGIFLLASGSSALNHYQDRKIDALMDRTKLRPIPSGEVHPIMAFFVAFFLIFSGSLILFFGSNSAALSLGILTVLWYNGVYTYLKRKSTFAVIPGALVGSMPPAVGWVAGGRNLLEPPMVAVTFFFFIWQVPHFWLLLLNYGADYEKAGLPSINKILTEKQLKRIIFIWILSTAVTCLLIPIFGIVNSFLINLSLLAAAIWLVWNATKLLSVHSKGSSSKLAFREINIYVLLVISLVFVDRLINLYW